jgi:hypothetical protein
MGIAGVMGSLLFAVIGVVTGVRARPGRVAGTAVLVASLVLVGLVIGFLVALQAASRY